MVSFARTPSTIKYLEIFKIKCKPSEVGLNYDKKAEKGVWMSANGAVVCQRSCGQEMTMARAGMLPENASFEELIPVQQQRNNSGDNIEEEINEEDTESKEEDMKFQNTRASVMLVWALMMKMLSQLLISFQVLPHSFLGVLADIGEALHSIRYMLTNFL